MNNSEELLNKIATAHLEPHIKSEVRVFLDREERSLLVSMDDIVESARQALIVIVHEANVSFEDCHLMRLLIKRAVEEVGYDASEEYTHTTAPDSEYYNDE